MLPATTHCDVGKLQAIAKRVTDAGELVEATRGQYPTALIQGRCMVGFLGKLVHGTAPATHEHVIWGAGAGDIISFRVDARHLDQLHSLTGLAYAQLAVIRRRMLDDAVRDAHADSVQRGITLPQAYTGRNTILGIVDAGFDYTHPMFYDTALTATRILAAWDQNKQSGPAPAGYGYGAAYEGAAELLAAQSDTADAWGIRDYHGTHVAGIAGGGGAGTPYRGVAFDAEFLFVSFGSDDAFSLDAYAWMHERATQEGKRLVVNASWGARDGPLDGTSLLSQAMEQFTTLGVLFVCANGNYGDVNCHIKRDFNGDTVRTRVAFSSSGWAQYEGQSLLIWGEGGMPFSASIAFTNTANTVLAATPWYSTASGPAFADSILVNGNDTLYFTAVIESAHPLNGKPMLRFQARRTSTMVKLALRMTAPDGVVHAWNDEYFTGGGALGGAEFQAPQPGWTAGDRQSTVIDPACAEGVIAVGAHRAEYELSPGNWSGGPLAGFSSRGPTVDGRMKPDLTAPGVDVVSSINSFTNLSFTTTSAVPFYGQDYPFGPLSGTSMATPLVSGCAALLLEAAPLATPAEVKEALLDNARMDNFTGNIPPQGSTAWGRGKVNAYRAITDLLDVVGVDEAEETFWAVWPNPVTGLLFIEQCDDAPAELALLDAVGRVVARPRSDSAPLSIDMRAYPSGTYLLVIKQAERTFGRRIVRQ